MTHSDGDKYDKYDKYACLESRLKNAEGDYPVTGHR